MKKIVLWLLIFSGQSLAQQGVVGYVYDAQNQKPIQGVLISVPSFQIQVRSDEQGRFTFPFTWADQQTLRLKHPDYRVLDTIVAGGISNLSFALRLGHMTTEEVTVSGQQMAARNKNTVPIEVKNIKDLQISGAMNVPELITKIPGVYNSSLGNGIAKPVIRGMQGMRVLTLVNGLRLESQQWGGDHGMGIGELALGSVEVIKGPASVLYGADALGGVIYLVDESYARIGQQTLEVQHKWNQNTNGSTTSMLYKTVKGTSGCWLQVVMPIMPIFNCRVACMLKIPASMKGLARCPIHGSSPIRCTNCGMRLIIPSQAYRAIRTIRWLRH